MSIYGVINAVCEVPDENEACPSRYPDFGRTSGDPATGIGIDSRRGRSAMTTASRSFTEAWLTEQVRGSAVGEDPPNHVMGVRWVQGRPAPVDAWADASSETLTGGRRGRLDVRRLQHTDSRTRALTHSRTHALAGAFLSAFLSEFKISLTSLRVTDTDRKYDTTLPDLVRVWYRSYELFISSTHTCTEA